MGHYIISFTISISVVSVIASQREKKKYFEQGKMVTVLSLIPHVLS